jgi:hypothetical protein
LERRFSEIVFPFLEINKIVIALTRIIRVVVLVLFNNILEALIAFKCGVENLLLRLSKLMVGGSH